MSKPIDLYIVPPSPPCRAVITAAKYMNIDINLIYVDLLKEEQKEDWFVKLNPQHCLPTINDNGFILWESRAIMTYFANQYAPQDEIYPQDLINRSTVDRLLQYDLNVLYRVLCEFLIPILRERKEISNLNPVIEKKVKEALSYLESILEKNVFLACDHLTLADISIYYSLKFSDDLKYDFSKYIKVNEWYYHLKRIIANIQTEGKNINFGENVSIKSIQDLHKFTDYGKI